MVANEPEGSAESAFGQGLRVSHVSKVFQGQRALDDVDIDVRPGEIHALLGQNGSGKSTLIKILSGYHQPEDGAEGWFNGEQLTLGDSDAAYEAGLRFIHQDLGLIQSLSVIDNLALGRKYAGRWWLSDHRERHAAERILAEYSMEDVDVSAPVRSLGPARESMLAIVRAVHSGLGDRGFLVLDEPTAALPEHEVRELFTLLRRLRARGVAILYVTHRLNEVFEIGDRVTVLRDGRRVATKDVADLNHDQLVTMIVGRPLTELFPPLPATSDEVALSVTNLRSQLIAKASFTAHSGEIVGLTGLIGSGYEEILAAVFGAIPRVEGEIHIAGTKLSPDSPADAIEAGVVYAPADRKRLGAMVEWTVRENVTLPAIPSSGPLRWLSDRLEEREIEPWVNSLNVVPAGGERVFSALSGGNQQKVVLARWLRCRPNVMLLDEPTFGVDVGARRGIYDALADAAQGGTAIVISSTDLEELSGVCDRVLIVRDGYVRDELSGEALTTENILLSMLRPEDSTGLMESQNA